MIPQVDILQYEKLQCLHDIFVKQANETPTKVAIVFNDKKITFGELNSITDALAENLRSHGVGKNKVVGIFMERCIEYSISYIAILKAGGAYLPIEMSYPTSLIKLVLEDAQPVVICSKNCYKNLLDTEIFIINLENNWLEIIKKENKLKKVIPMDTVSLDDMAYTVYSSGTTGKPKGIQCPHRGAVFSYTWRHLAFPYEEEDREACNVFFVWEMLRPLLKGISMYIIPDDVIYDPSKLLQFLHRNKITRMLFTPSLLETILNSQNVKLTESFQSMKQIWLCGEVVTTTLRNRIALTFPWIKILNLYSISECHDLSCADLTEGIGLEGKTYCPVGTIFPGLEVTIFDENFNKKLIGETGEILVNGPTLAIGYLNRPDLNKQKFIRIPHLEGKTAINRWYKTGDWGYFLSDGSLEIVGRCDSMVKIRGYTIELKAVESAILNSCKVNMTCVLAIGEEGSDKILVAYIVLNKNYLLNAGDIRSNLKKLLPFYMIPSQFIFLDKIPVVTATGKIDTSKLPLIGAFDEDKIIINDETMDDTSKLIAKIWCKILKLHSVDMDDNFFNLGGHSLLAAVAISKINELFSINLSTLDLYINSTVKELSIKIKTGVNSMSNNIDFLKEVDKYDVKCIPKILLQRFWKSINFHKNQFRHANVLLTGATGFLGSFILYRLLNDTEMTVYCLVKESGNKNSTERIENILKANNLSLQLLNLRVIPISSDISLKKFGLDEIEYDTLSYDIDIVIHCAAYVNLVLPYIALKSANVVGTQNLISFCLQGKLKPLHYISTNDVFPQGMVNCSETADMSQNIAKLKHGYSQSKWVAEQIVLRALQNGLPVVISRCGNIGGSQFSTSWNSNDMILLIIQGVILSESAPDISWQIELTPVDFTSDIIVKLTQNLMMVSGKVYHIINENSTDCRILWSLLQKIGYSIKLMSYETWIEAVTKSCVKFPQLQSLLQLLNTTLKNGDYLIKSSSFIQENLNEFLTSNNIQYPRVNDFLLKRYINNLIIGKYIPVPPAPYDLIAENTKLVLKRKVALITGASSGIGYEITKTLAQAGIVTVGVARNLDQLLKLKDELQAKNIYNFVPVKLNITIKNEVISCLSNVMSIVGPVNILINNAGVMEYCKMINCDIDLWMDMVNVNCIGFLNLLAAILPHMKTLQAGHIINITSDAGKKAFSGLAVYSGTKFFEEAVSEAMRQEIASYGIKVTCIQPGDVDTGLHQKSKDKKTLSEYMTQTKFLNVKEIANVVLFTLSQSHNCAINSILVEPLMAPI